MPPRKNKREKLDEEEKRKKLDEEEKRITTFAKIVEEQLEMALSNTDDNCIQITHHTVVIIDDVPVQIFVTKYNDNTYSYHITSTKLKSSISDEHEAIDIIFLEIEDLPNVLELLTNLEEVKKTYRFFEHKLVSPKEYEFAQNQRIFFPIPSDKTCSVCYESTIEYSTCNHPICFKCRMKCILSDKDSCPICRGSELSIFPDVLTYTLCL